MKKTVAVFLFAATVFTTRADLVQNRLVEYNIFPSSVTLIWRETTTDWETDEQTFRYYKQVYQGTLAYDKEVEAVYTPGEVIEPVIDFGNE